MPLFVVGCSYNLNTPPQTWLDTHHIPAPDLKYPLHLCQNFGCQKRQTFHFSPEHITAISEIFTPQPTTSIQERQNIAQAIGLMEHFSGQEIGTHSDLPQNEFSFTSSHQLDCVAESLNTTSYLLLLEQLKLLQFHRVGSNTHRGFLQLYMPHNSATIIEVHSQIPYVVDSWYYTNGEPAWITRVSNWQEGAEPTERP